MKLPYFKWYPKDAESDEVYSLMNDTELGFYHRCLNKAWVNEGLPADLKELARLMRVTDAQLKKVWPIVGRCFLVSEASGRLINPRQQEERTKAMEKSEQAADAGRKRQRSVNESLESAEPRALAGAESAYEYESSSEETTTTNQEKASTRANDPWNKPEQKAWFDGFWETYWRKTAKSEAAKVFRKKVTTAEVYSRVMTAVGIEKPVMLARNPEHRPHATTWLNQDRFDDEPDPPMIPAPTPKSKLESLMELI